MRRGAAWLVTAPIALAGVVAAHAVANRLTGSPEGAGELFSSAESGAEMAPALGALAVSLVLVGLARRVAGAHAGRRARAVPFACLAPVAFVVLELLEGVAHRGGVPWHELLEPTFAIGLLLQLPFAAAGYVVARLLLRISDAVRQLIVPRWSALRRPVPTLVAFSTASERPRRTTAHAAHPGRGPPRGGLLSG